MHDFTDFRQPNFTKFEHKHVHRCYDEYFWEQNYTAYKKPPKIFRDVGRELTAYGT